MITGDIMKIIGKKKDKKDKNDMTYRECFEAGEYARAFAILYSLIMNSPPDISMDEIRQLGAMMGELLNTWLEATPNDANYYRGYIMFKGRNIDRKDFFELKDIAEKLTPVDKELSDWFIRGVDVVIERELNSDY